MASTFPPDLISAIIDAVMDEVGEWQNRPFDSCYPLVFFDAIRELIAGHAILSMVIDAMLKARAALWSEFTKLHREMLRIARADKVCRRLMSAPGVGALVALT